MFFNQYRVSTCRYVIELSLGITEVAHHQPLPAVSSDPKHLPYTTGNLQRSDIPCHLTQSRGKPSATWNFCQYHHTATLLTGRGQFGKREAAETSSWNCVLQKTPFFPWSPQCWSVKTNKDFLGLFLCNGSARFVVVLFTLSPQYKRSVQLETVSVPVAL